jgi:hypothetical protein
MAYEVLEHLASTQNTPLLWNFFFFQNSTFKKFIFQKMALFLKLTKIGICRPFNRLLANRRLALTAFCTGGLGFYFFDAATVGGPI